MKISPEAMQRLYKVLNSDTPDDPLALGVKDMVENYGYDPNLINNETDAINVIMDTDDYNHQNLADVYWGPAQTFADATDDDLLNGVASRDSAENLLAEMYNDMQTTGAPTVIPNGTSDLVDDVINAGDLSDEALDQLIRKSIGPSQLQMYFPEFNYEKPGNRMYGLPPINKLR